MIRKIKHISILVVILLVTLSLVACSMKDNDYEVGLRVENYFQTFFTWEKDIVIYPEVYNYYYDNGELVKEYVPSTVSNDGIVDTSKAGKQTFTVTVEETDEELYIDIYILDFVLQDGIYTSVDSDGILIIQYKSVNNKIYLFDYNNNCFETTEATFSEMGILNNIISYDENGDILYSYDNVYYINYVGENKDLSATVSFIIKDNTIQIIDKHYDEDKITRITSLNNPYYNSIALIIENNLLTSIQFETLKSIGIITTDEEMTQVVTIDTNITTKTLYIHYDQEDYSGKPFLGTYYYTEESLADEIYFVIGADRITYPEDVIYLNYEAKESEDGWIITISGENYYFNNKDKTLLYRKGSEPEYTLILK